MRVFREEIFGPVLVAMPFDDEAEAIRLANATEYGLAAYVWTNDIRRAHRVAQAIDTGMCWVNSQNVRDLRTPFGGVKDSGIGREGGDYASSSTASIETIHVALGTHAIPRIGMPDAEEERLSATVAQQLLKGPSEVAVRHHARRLRRAAACATSTRRGTSTWSCSACAVSARTATSLTSRAGRSACTTRSSCARASTRRRRAGSASACATDADLDLLADWYAERGGTVRMGDADLRGMTGRTLRVRDRSASRWSSSHEMELCRPCCGDYHLHRGAPIMRFDHVNLHVLAVEEALVHWQQLGFRCSEYISTDSASRRADHRGVDAAQRHRARRRAHRRRGAAAASRRHVRSPSRRDPARATSSAARLDAAIERGPGRHGVSNAFFVYLRDPDGHRLELYTCDYYTGDPDHVPLRWSVNDPRCRSFWGTRAPDCWYDGERRRCSAPTASPSRRRRRPSTSAISTRR